MGIDIGLRPIETRSEWERRIFHQTNILCDWIVLEYLESITPIVDSNMFKIYAKEFNKNIDGLTDEELANYANVYKTQITAFIYNNIFTRIFKIVDRTKHLYNKFVSIPTNAKGSFDNYLTFVKTQPDANATGHFVRFKSELLRNTENWFRRWHEDLDASRYIIPADRYNQFVEIVENKINLCFKASNDKDTVAIDYKQKLGDAIDHLKTLLLICYQFKIDKHEMAKDIFEKDISIYFPEFRKYIEAVIPYMDKFNAVKPAHAVCVYTNTIDVDLKLVEEPSGFNTTDEYRFLVTALAQELMLNDKAK